MARRRVAVHPDGLPKMLLEILAKAFRAAPDIDIVSAGDADVLVMSDRTDATHQHALDAPVIIEIASDGRQLNVIRPGRGPEQMGDYSDAVLLDLVRDTAPVARRGFLSNLFGRPPPQDEQPANPNPDTAVSDYFAVIATRLLHSIKAPPPNGPRKDLFDLAKTVASQGRGGTSALPLGLAHIQQAFGLNAGERDLLFLASLVEADPVAARMVALLNDHLLRPRPTIGSLSVLGHDPFEIAGAFRAGALSRFALASIDGNDPLVTLPVRAHPDVWPVVLGLERDPPFRTVNADGDAFLALSSERLVELGRVSDVIGSLAPRDVLVLVAGDSGVGRAGIAGRLARHLCPTALIVSTAQLGDPADLAALARECTLQNAAVIVTDAEKLDSKIWTRVTRRLTGPLFATTCQNGAGALALNADRSAIQFQAPRRDIEHRARMWAAAAPEHLAETAGDLSERFDFSHDHIASALSLAQSGAKVLGRDAPTATDLRAACETLRDTRFEGMAERLDCPFVASDIVLAADTQAELDLATTWARHGTRLFSPGGAGAGLHTGRGLTCLFTGPPGVGKTMAARIMAAKVDFAIYRIDLSQVVDKFIGESEKRLSALFDEAERARVALFFDEADALFGKRTDVRDSHDRYANITVDHLLQRIDDFEGLAILATNLAGNLDDAFLRRIKVRAEFRAPDAAERRQIWGKMLGPACQGDIDLARLADPFDLVGGEIRNAVYSAHLYAADADRPIAMEDCVRGLWRELRKVGRLVDPAHLGDWRDVVS